MLNPLRFSFVADERNSVLLYREMQLGEEKIDAVPSAVEIWDLPSVHLEELNGLFSFLWSYIWNFDLVLSAIKSSWCSLTLGTSYSSISAFLRFLSWSLRALIETSGFLSNETRPLSEVSSLALRPEGNESCLEPESMNIIVWLISLI